MTIKDPYPPVDRILLRQDLDISRATDTTAIKIGTGVIAMSVDRRDYLKIFSSIMRIRVIRGKICSRCEIVPSVSTYLSISPNRSTRETARTA